MGNERTYSRRRRLGITGVITAVALAAGSAIAWQFSAGGAGPDALLSEPKGTSEEVNLEKLGGQIAAFCGDCHAAPPPGTFPRDAWFAEVQQGFNFYYESGRRDLDVPPMSSVVTWFRERAPERLDIPVPENAPGGLRFQKNDLQVDNAAPAVAFLNWSPPATGRSAALLGCEMRSGQIWDFQFDAEVAQIRMVAKLAHPAHLTWTDLDGDGVEELLVSELGSFKPGDHQNGKIIWLRPPDSGPEWTSTVIAEGLGRVADVQVADFDGDGDADLVLAEFGWRKTGRILLLENNTIFGEQPQFETHVLDERHGTIHVPSADLNGDGHADFVALISQEYEVIEAFLGNGDGTFRKERIFDAGDPSFGSSGIQLVDLDKDGDLDVLYTNGDTLDSHHLKPSHAVHWLENRDVFPFAHHLLTTMPGVCRALAGDLDRDGDLDVVACAAILSALRTPVHEGVFDSLIWLEQSEPGRFDRHRINGAGDGYVALDLGDFNGDGTLDLATGRFQESSREWMTIWWNRGGVADPVSD